MHIEIFVILITFQLQLHISYWHANDVLFWAWKGPELTFWCVETDFGFACLSDFGCSEICVAWETVLKTISFI